MEIIREASVPVFFVMRPAFQYCASWSLAAGKVARNGRNRAHTKTDERDIRPMVSVSLWTPTSRRLSRLADAEHRDPWCCIERIAADRKAQYRKLGIFRDGEKALCQAHNPPLLLEIPLSRTTCQDSAIQSTQTSFCSQIEQRLNERLQLLSKFRFRNKPICTG